MEKVLCLVFLLLGRRPVVENRTDLTSINYHDLSITVGLTRLTCSKNTEFVVDFYVLQIINGV